MAVAENPAVDGLITRVDRVWMLGPFKKVLERRRRETVLLGHLEQCIRQLFENPRHSGLNLETLHHSGRLQVLSARITQAYRLILTPLSRTELGLLYFDHHDVAYHWVDRNRTNLPTMLSKVAEVSRDTPLMRATGPVAFPQSEPDDPIAIVAADQFRQMLDSGIVRYLTYLDEDQRRLVDLNVSGLLVVKGGAGTGKTAVAIHRVLALARKPTLLGPSRVLYLCFNRALARAVVQLMESLCGGELLPDVEIKTFHTWCAEFVEQSIGERPQIDEDACDQTVDRAFGELSREQRAALGKLDVRFVVEEIVQVIKHNGLASYEAYRDFNRRGRKEKLGQDGREVVWDVHERAMQFQKQQGIYRYSDLPLLALSLWDTAQERPQYRAVVIDEGQDFPPVMVRLARRLLEESQGPLTVFADPAQAIYKCGFQWTQMELRPKGGNVHWLRKPYRCTREVFDLARGLLDGQTELAEDLAQLRIPERHGPTPCLVATRDHTELQAELVQRVAREVRERPPNQIAVLAGRWETLRNLADELNRHAIPSQVVDDGDPQLEEQTVKLVTIHSAKGLDFPVVFLVGPHRDDLGGDPLAESSETVHLLYVALTRASETLTILVVDGKHHRLLQRLDDQCYRAEGSRGREFVNLRLVRDDLG